MLRFTETQSVATQRVIRVRADVRACPTRRYAKVMTASLRVMKKLGRA